MKIGKTHIIGAIIGLIVIGVSIIFLQQDNFDIFLFVAGLGFGIVFIPFIIQITLDNKRIGEINETFLEFSRNLSESVKTGTPVSKSIINLRSRNYGSLSPYIEKLANQISLGIPINRALETFAIEVDSPVISRAVTLIREAEKAGGEIESILESSAKSIAEIEKLKKERKSAVSTLIAQGYIIFFIFIAIMLIMEFKIVPMTSTIGELNIDLGSMDATAIAQQVSDGEVDTNNLANPAEDKRIISPFLSLLLVQGMFAGLIIGKISEGYLKAGIRHSFILMMSAFLISTGARIIF